jgi:DNA-binding transcriptional LysR family regulator
VTTQFELRHLRYFLAVAEELNFSRAAERLYIAQPALSAQIRALEAQLGCSLFSRTTRKVELTAAGRLLLDDARAIVARADRAAAKLAAVARGQSGLLRIGFAAHGAGEIGTRILRQFAAEFPQIETKLVEAVNLEELQLSVRDRATDVAFAWLPVAHKELLAEPVVSERRLAAVNASDPLAAADEVTAVDLEAAPIVGPWEHVGWETLAYWVEPFRPDGRRSGDPSAKTVDESLAIVARGLAVYCVPESVERFYPRPEVVYRPIAGMKPAQIAVIWHREPQNPAVTSFVEVARAMAAD